MVESFSERSLTRAVAQLPLPITAIFGMKVAASYASLCKASAISNKGHKILKRLKSIRVKISMACVERVYTHKAAGMYIPAPAQAYSHMGDFARLVAKKKQVGWFQQTGICLQGCENCLLAGIALK